ncbi:MAG: HAD family hydrolase [Candidatus Kariarchaeaceae archaeon]
MNIDISNIEAIIFDCDGVLVDSESLSCYALNIVFEEMYGIDIGTDYTQIIGTSLEYALKHYIELYGIEDYDINELSQEKEKAYFQLAADRLNTFHGCEDFIQLLLKKDYKIAVASSGSHSKIKYSLNRVNLKSYFSQIYSSEDVLLGKPKPDLFLHVSKEMEILPENCLVIEDSVNGVYAATNAGMQVVGFPGSFPEKTLTDAGAFFVNNGYSDLIQIFNST